MQDLANDVLPLDEQQHNKLQDAVSGLSAAQLQWVSGFAAGLAASNAPVAQVPELPGLGTGQQLTVLVGSQTGNGTRVAEQLVAMANERGYAAQAVSLAEVKSSLLKRESLVTFVVSTHGEGDPPDDAELFYEYLMSSRAGPLTDLRYAVLALGDSSYVNFCQTGREFDQRLAELGAQRFADIVECDLDFDEKANVWSASVVEQLPELVGTGSGDKKLQSPAPILRAVSATPTHGRENPFGAEVLVNQKISGAGSSKDVRHIELSLKGSAMSYEPGDALAVLATNPPELVDEFLDALALQPAERVDIEGATHLLRDALLASVEITVLSLPFLHQWARQGSSDALQSMLAADDPDQLAGFMNAHQVIDVVRRYPAEVDAQTFVGMLRQLSPRSYSIASSPTANPEEVHLTVAAVRYEAFGRPHWGAASTMLADRFAAGAEVSVFVEANPRFRLPGPDTPIVMIGAGTGIAPFRAFVEERNEQNASGGNWLFFGDRSFSHDFLYQLEWQRYLKRGDLDRLDVAFSRDQRKKVYVQDRLRERGEELYRWIQRGAVIYVCGDAKHMAGDVESALVEVLSEHGRTDRDTAAAQLKSMRLDKRYQRDVY